MSRKPLLRRTDRLALAMGPPAAAGTDFGPSAASTSMCCASTALPPVCDLSSDLLAILDAGGCLQAVNAAWERVLGWPAIELVGRRVAELLVAEQRNGFSSQLASLVDGAPCAELGLRMLARGGEPRLIRARLRRVGARVELAGRDEASDARARGHLDALTWLAGREMFTDQLERRLEQAASERGGPFAVLFLDLDGFKAVNDRLGHDAGDRLLREVASRLLGAVRPGDTVGRLGGDEFGIVLAEVADGAEAMAIAERIAQAIAEPVWLSGRAVMVTASVGATLSQAADHTAGDLLRRADRAMYAAKEGETCQLYDAAAERRDQRRWLLESEIEAARERGELEVRYQVKVALAPVGLAGFQALLRWRHPELGVLRPVHFLQLAEHRGALPEIESWLLRQALALLAKRQAGPPCAVSANLSAASFGRLDLGDHLAQLLDEAGLNPAHLQVEVREDVLLDRPRDALRHAERLRDDGIGLYVDGWGAGRSSLAILERFPVAGLKIDHRLVRQLPAPRVVAFLRALLRLGDDLALDVVAEGVETATQLASLRDLGCRSVEGALALPAEQAMALRHPVVDAEDWVAELLGPTRPWEDDLAQ
jgi:diguanylate cyclase (GGDEF)-like protein